MGAHVQPATTREAPRFELRFSLTQGTFTVALALDITARAVVLFGPSGSGKTSVLEAVAGLRTPQDGRIAVRGRVLFDVETRTNVQVRDRHLGYVPQDVLLFPHLDVRRNITYASRRADTKLRGLDLPGLTRLLGLTELMDRKVAGLSGGERQRVALARALQSGPDVLLLDEPLAAVDLARRRLILESLVAIRDKLGVPLIYVTHSPDEARAIADYAVVMDDGKVVAAGSPADVLKQ